MQRLAKAIRWPWLALSLCLSFSLQAQTRLLSVGSNTDGLIACEADAKAVRALCQDEDYGKLLLTPTIAEVKASATSLFGGAWSDHWIVFYFSGHGLPSKQLLMADGAMSLTIIEQIMLKSKAAKKIIVLDCCYAKQFKRTAGIVYLTPAQLLAIEDRQQVKGLWTKSNLTRLKSIVQEHKL